LAQLSETYEGGVHIGYRITCRRHRNATDPPDRCCQKDITMGKTDGRLENEECIRRLKRWFIMGANSAVEACWADSAIKRSDHIKYGSSRLHQLATDYEPCPLHGVGDDELNALCESVDL